MSQLLEWRERLNGAHNQLHEAMTELITNKNYSKARNRRERHQIRLMEMICRSFVQRASPMFFPHFVGDDRREAT
jgi:hypothetical protein